MKIERAFTVAQPLPRVWDFFQDIPAVAACLPGAEYDGPSDGGRHRGRVSARIGPFQASFEGEADVSYDADAGRIEMQGKGVDRKGASRGKMRMTCTLSEVEGATAVAVDADVQLSGSIAQFGRTGLIAEVANLLIDDFVRNAEAELSRRDDSAPGSDDAPDAAAAAEDRTAAPAPETSPAAPVGGFGLIFRALWARLRALFGGRA